MRRLKSSSSWASIEVHTNAEGLRWRIRLYVSGEFMHAASLSLAWVLCGTAGDIKKAKDAGFHTCQGMMMATKKVFVLASALLINQYCRSLLQPQKFACSSS